MVPPKRYKVDNSSVWENLFERYKTGELCDVVLIADIDGQSISAHRIVLSAATEYFRAMFSKPFKEQNLGEIRIGNVKGDILRKMIEFSYTGEFGVNEADVDELMAAAVQLQFTQIVQKCAEFYAKILRPSNCLGIRSLADKYDLGFLKEDVGAFVHDYFMEIVNCDEFLQLDQKAVVDMLKDDNIKVDTEEDVFRAAMKWIEFNADERKPSLQMLMDAVRFHHITETVILNQIFTDCSRLKAGDVFLRIVEHRSIMSEKQRPSTGFRGFYFVDCGIIGEFPIYIYCSRRNEWSEFTECKVDVHWFGLVYHAGKAIVIGGQNHSQKAMMTVFNIDLNSGDKTDLPPLISKRCGLSAALIRDEIYAVGGFGGNNTYLSTVERFDFEKTEWKKVAPMSRARAYMTSVVHSGSLFVFGGGNGRGGTHNSVECYDRSSNQWRDLAPMRHPRRGATACSLNGFIYVCGGGETGAPVGAIERYDPQIDTWIELEFQLPSPRCFSGAAIGDGDWLYIAGGLEIDPKVWATKSVQKINLTTGGIENCEDLILAAPTGYLFRR